MSNPPYRINNKDVEELFGKIDNLTNFRIAREKLIQEGLIYGKNVNFDNPPYFQITGDGIIYYEKKNYLDLKINREYTLLVSKILTFLRDIGDQKYNIDEYISGSDLRSLQAKIPLQHINKILAEDYDLEMNELAWNLLYNTSRFVSRHFMGISGIGMGKEYLSFHNPNTFSLNLEGYNFLNDTSMDEESQYFGNENKTKFIRNLLNIKECEYLDFKLTMHDLLSENKKRKWEQRKEFLKDLLSLINNKTYDNNPGKAYIIIGAGEKNGKYNSTHNNIEFIEYQTIIQLINEYITPKLSINFEEYYISRNKTNKLIANNEKDGYDRNLIIIVTYVIGTVYELKKEIGNPNFNVPYYHTGTSFTRDNSHARRLTHEDRVQIMDLFDMELMDEFEPDIYVEDYSPENIAEKTKMDMELIKRYTEILKTKKISPDNAERIINRIKNQTRLLAFYKEPYGEDVVKTLIEFVKFSCNFIQNKNERINNLIFVILYELTVVREVVPVIKDGCFDYFETQFNDGNRYSYLVRLLNKCDFFKDLIGDINRAIDQKDLPLLALLINFDFNTPQIKTNKWKIIEDFIDKKEDMDVIEDNILIGRIQEIIEKIDALK